VQQDAHRILHIHQNVPGMLSAINQVLSERKVNILGQYLKTNRSIGYVVLDINKTSSRSVMEELSRVPHTIRARNLY
jgi:D-3-phosphoglycerate dehydrogenase / 2-oxoglutarate reductase